MSRKEFILSLSACIVVFLIFSSSPYLYKMTIEAIFEIIQAQAQAQATIRFVCPARNRTWSEPCLSLTYEWAKLTAAWRHDHSTPYSERPLPRLISGLTTDSLRAFIRTRRCRSQKLLRQPAKRPNDFAETLQDHRRWWPGKVIVLCTGMVRLSSTDGGLSNHGFKAQLNKYNTCSD